MSVRVSKATRITRVSVEFCRRGSIVGDIGETFVSLNLGGMKFKGDEDGYFYDNWTLEDLREFADAAMAFIREHEEGRKQLGKPTPEAP